MPGRGEDGEAACVDGDPGAGGNPGAVRDGPIDEEAFAAGRAGPAAIAAGGAGGFDTGPWAGACGAGLAGDATGAAGRWATAAVEAVGADGLAPGRGAVEAVGLIGCVSEGLGRAEGDVDGLADAEAGADCDVGAPFINCLI
jgi:hypothetical protein